MQDETLYFDGCEILRYTKFIQFELQTSGRNWSTCCVF
jgi:hypothetical protein